MFYLMGVWRMVNVVAVQFSQWLIQIDLDVFSSTSSSLLFSSSPSSLTTRSHKNGRMWDTFRSSSWTLQPATCWLGFICNKFKYYHLGRNVIYLLMRRANSHFFSCFFFYFSAARSLEAARSLNGHRQPQLSANIITCWYLCAAQASQSSSSSSSSSASLPSS